MRASGRPDQTDVRYTVLTKTFPGLVWQAEWIRSDSTDSCRTAFFGHRFGAAEFTRGRFTLKSLRLDTVYLIRQTFTLTGNVKSPLFCFVLLKLFHSPSLRWMVVCGPVLTCFICLWSVIRSLVLLLCSHNLLCVFFFFPLVHLWFLILFLIFVFRSPFHQITLVYCLSVIYYNNWNRSKHTMFFFFWAASVSRRGVKKTLFWYAQTMHCELMPKKPRLLTLIFPPFKPSQKETQTAERAFFTFSSTASHFSSQPLQTNWAIIRALSHYDKHSHFWKKINSICISDLYFSHILSRLLICARTINSWRSVCVNIL